MKYKESEKVWCSKCYRFYKVNFEVNVTGVDVTVTPLNDICPKCKIELHSGNCIKGIITMFSKKAEAAKTKDQETLLIGLKNVESILIEKHPEDADLRAAFKYIKTRACGE